MFTEMVQTFTDDMRQAGYQVMVSLSGYASGTEYDLVRGLLGRRPDAMLITGAEHAPPMRQMLAEAGIPVVEVFDVAPQPIDMLVGLDHAAVGAAVAAFFHARGFRAFAVFAAGDARARRRQRGFVEAVERAGGSVLAAPVLPAPSTIARRAARRCATSCRMLTEPHRAVLQLRHAGVRRDHRGAAARHRRARNGWRCAASAISS